MKPLSLERMNRKRLNMPIDLFVTWIVMFGALTSLAVLSR
jgi:hypothetical protein